MNRSEYLLWLRKASGAGSGRGRPQGRNRYRKEEKRDCGTGDRQRKSDIRGGISLHTDTVADEKLIYHVVKSAYQHGNDAWDSESGHQMIDRFTAKRVFVLIFQKNILLFLCTGKKIDAPVKKTDALLFIIHVIVPKVKS